MKYFQDTLFYSNSLYLSNYVYVIKESDNQKEIVREPFRSVIITQDCVMVSCGLCEDYIIGENAFDTESDAIANILIHNSNNPLVKSMLMLYQYNDGLEKIIDFLALNHSCSYIDGELDDICNYELMNIPDNNIYQFRNTITGQRFDVCLLPIKHGSNDDTDAVFSYVDMCSIRHNVKRASEAISKYWVE